MSVYTIADLHLALGCPDKSMEAFGGRWSDYANKIKTLWEETVSREDTVVLAGDISWGMSLNEAREDLAFINSLPGKKLILEGNHDFWWNSVTKMDKFCKEQNFETLSFLRNNAYFCDGLAVCGTRGWYTDDRSVINANADPELIVPREAGRLRRSLEMAAELSGEPVVFMHFPPVYGDYFCDAFVDIMLEYGVRRCFFGHIHGRYDTAGCLYRGIEFRLISADSLNFKPYKI